ncbi:thiamine phosphate synthase [Paenibacillus odorifer]|uniref:thiamine phosphate synthase n=1 Tax=Paenibacillus odorifer TaxID=189426 RepID=UPI001C37627E|nr:thiamine phosphate synthase [Paenibacillus odorifer]
MREEIVMLQAEIHLISDGKLQLRHFVELAVTVQTWVDYIHLRDKQCPACELLAAAQQLLAAGMPATKLIINDRIDVALAAGAAGVQLAWHSLSPVTARRIAPQLRLGRSVHSPEEAANASEQGADYCLFGHVFPSDSKLGLPARGLELLAETVETSSIPVIAIGGISLANAAQIIRQGAAGVAVMSGICGADDPYEAAKAIHKAVHS